jgi:VIT1/CCC1 family predicted Fe2+/Mn2+ transporter
MPHGERHRSERIGWLRAAVLGANDGIVSTASLVVGVAAAASARQDVLPSRRRPPSPSERRYRYSR